MKHDQSRCTVSQWSRVTCRVSGIMLGCHAEDSKSGGWQDDSGSNPSSTDNEAPSSGQSYNDINEDIDDDLEGMGVEQDGPPEVDTYWTSLGWTHTIICRVQCFRPCNNLDLAKPLPCPPCQQFVHSRDALSFVEEHIADAQFFASQ